MYKLHTNSSQLNGLKFKLGNILHKNSGRALASGVQSPRGAAKRDLLLGMEVSPQCGATPRNAGDADADA